MSDAPEDLLDAVLALLYGAEYHEAWGRSEAETVRTRVLEVRQVLRAGPVAVPPSRLYKTVKPRHMDFGGWDSDLAERRPPSV